MKNNEKLWRSFNSDLKKAYYKPFKGNKRRWQCGDSRVDPDQWRLLVEHQEKDETAVRIITQMLNHTSGTKSYARSKAQYVSL